MFSLQMAKGSLNVWKAGAETQIDSTLPYTIQTILYDFKVLEIEKNINACREENIFWAITRCVNGG